MNPRVRRDLDVISIRDGQYLLSDGRHEAGFAVSAAERYLCALLDGTRPPREVMNRYRERFREPLTSRNLEEFVEQLRVHNLLEEAPAATRDRPVRGGDGLEPKAPAEARTDVPRGRTLPEGEGRRGGAVRLNRLLDLLLVAFGWLIHPIWCVPIAIAAFFAAPAFVGSFDLFREEVVLLAVALPIPILVFFMAVRVFVVDLLSTLVRAMALRKHGARIQRFGLTLYHWVIPVFVCDPGTSVRRLDERGRTAQLTSRIWAELALGSIAVLGWQQAASGSLTRQFCLLLTIPILFGLALQLNPLVPLDASRILARWLDRPDLYEQARAEVRGWVLGRVGPEALGPGERVWIRLYGLASYLWTIAFHLVVLIGGLWLHTELYGRAGAYWWALLGTLWYGASIRNGLERAFKAVTHPEGWIRGGGEWYIRWPARLLLAGVLALVPFIPYDHEIIGDARLVPAAEQGVRTQLTDEITEVAVSEGEWVSSGSVLVRLSGRDVTAAIASTEADLARATADLAKLETGPRREDIDIARHEVDRFESELKYHELRLRRQTQLFEQQTVSRETLDEAQRLQGNAVQRLALARSELELLEEGTRQEEILAKRAQVAYHQAQLEKHRRDLALTELRSPISGRVSTPNVDARVGQVAEKGDLVLVVQDTSRLRVEIVAPEEAAVWVKPGMVAKVRLRALDGGLLTARVESVGQYVWREQSVDPPPFRSDREQFAEEARERDTDEFRVRIVARLEDDPGDDASGSIRPHPKGRAPLGRALVGMTGEARIVVGRSVLGRSLLRPVVRFGRTEVWSWLP